MAAAGLSALRRGQVPGVPKRPIVHGNSAEIVFPNTFCATEIFIEKIILKKIEKNDFFQKMFVLRQKCYTLFSSYPIVLKFGMQLPETKHIPCDK